VKRPAALAVLFAIASGSCSSDPLTQIVVVVDSDSRDWTRLEARVEGFAEPAVVPIDPAQRPLPRRFSIVHDGGPLGPIAVTVSAYRAGDATPALVEPRTGISFVSGQTKLLRINLYQACIRKCAAGMACLADGRCVSSDEAAVLQPWTGSATPLEPGAVGVAGGSLPGSGGGGAGGAGGSMAGPDAGGTAGLGADTGPPPPMWDYTPSNFDAEAVGAGVPDGTHVVLDCGDATFDSSDQEFDGFCDEEPVVTVVKQVDGSEAVVLAMASLVIAQGSSLTLSGDRPVIVAVYGDAKIAGLLSAGGATGVDGPGAGRACAMGAGSSGGMSPGGNSGSGGGSGGGFGSPGGSGGSNGTSGTRVDGGGEEGDDTLVPLRGGCPGGKGGVRMEMALPAAGGGGGGAVQVSARGKLTIGGTVSAPGGGGGGGEDAKDGGAGGGSGGAILLEGSPVAIGPDAFVTANGGGGGGGRAHDGGGTTQAGVGGAIVALEPASGGEGAETGAHGGGGAAVRASAAGGGDPSASGLLFDYGAGGGGGGGVGRIRVNGATSCVPGGSFSPVPFVVCPACGVCPVAPALGCLPATYDGAYYFSCSVAANWMDANATCASAGMDLVRVDGAEEDEWLRALVDADAWIGATDGDAEGKWRWSRDGAQFWMGGAGGSTVGGLYAGWGSTEPNDIFSIEDCARIEPDGWADVDCGDAHPFVCER
jgi:hypothetical protein